MNNFCSYLYLQILEKAGLSDYDRALIIAKYNSLYKKETIDPKIFQNRTEAEIKYLRKTMGQIKNISCNLEFSKEYNQYPEYEHFNFVMMASHTFNKSGILPFPGSLSEQPAQIMDIIETIFELDAEREEDAHRAAQAKKGKNV